MDMIHGMWLPFLLTELLWYSVVSVRSRLQILVPSWSWPSVAGWVHRYTSRLFPGTLVSVETQFIATVSLGASVQETATPDAQTLHVTAQMLPIETKVRPHEREGAPWVFRLNDGRTLSARNESESWDGRWERDTLETYNTDLWATQIIQVANLEGTSTIYWSFGLILMPVDRQKSVFRRVGSYSLEWDEVGQKNLSSAGMLFQKLHH